jgi:hypothetical protein
MPLRELLATAVQHHRATRADGNRAAVLAFEQKLWETLRESA